MRKCYQWLITLIAWGTRVVLIVDELNRFELPLDLGLSTFFKVHFLDKENFYLVFSSHQPLDIEAIRIAMSSSHSFFGLAVSPRGSGRGVVLPRHLPQICDLSVLRQMRNCSALTQCAVSLCGGIPSLLYAFKNHHTEEPILALFQRKRSI